MLKYFYSAGFKKQEIYLVLGVVALLVSSLIIKAVYQQELPYFDYSVRQDEVRLAAENSFKKNIDSEKLNRIISVSDSLEALPEFQSSGKNIFTPGNKLNISKAYAGDLELLPGIGRVIAERIIAYRDDHGFKDIRDIMKVKGIGKVKFEKIKDFITVN
jgi:competence protein ComEA